MTERDNSISRTTAGKEYLQRLKERFRRNTLRDFNDRETFELLLAYALPKKDVRPLVNSLLERFGCLQGVMEAGARDIESVDGVGENVSVLIDVIRSITGSYSKGPVKKGPVIRTKQDVLNHVNRNLTGKKTEKFLAIHLNSRNEMLGTTVLHEGPLNRDSITPRKTIEETLRHNGHGIIFVHKHPRAGAAPTVVERRLLKSLLNAVAAVDIIVHDHLILSRLEVWSALEHGLVSGGSGYYSKAASP